MSARRAGSFLRAGLCGASLLVMGRADVCAATVVGLANSAGIAGGLASWGAINGWFAHLAAATLPVAGGLALLAGGAAGWWRGRLAPPRSWPALRGPGPAKRRSSHTTCLPPRAPVVLPVDLARAALLLELKQHFVRLQSAWDAGELATLRALTTPEMFDELCLERPKSLARHDGDRTCVITLRAELLGFEQLAQTRVVSVEFSGLIREGPDDGATPFREFWMFAKSESDPAGWRLARHQALI